MMFSTLHQTWIIVILLCLGLVTPSARTPVRADNNLQDRIGHTATLLQNGKVLVVGGANTLVAFQNFAEPPDFPGWGRADLYDPASNSWTAAAPMQTTRLAHTATLLTNGQVLVTGGMMGDKTYASVERYNPTTNAWSARASMTIARAGHAAVLLKNDKVLVIGGINRFSKADKGKMGAELYDPRTDTWTTVASPKTERFATTVTLLPDGDVLLVAGMYHDPDACHNWEPPHDLCFSKTAERYDPTLNSWRSAGFLSVEQAGHTSTLLADGTVLIANGVLDAPIERYDPKQNTWKVVEGGSRNPIFATATLLKTGMVLFVGMRMGKDQGGATVLYDPANNTWNDTEPIVKGRMFNTATLLNTVKVLVVGGATTGC